MSRSGPRGDSPARLDATVSGRVQGVGFRYFVLREGSGLGLDGWVANEPDGRVRCVAEGDRESLERLLEQLSLGPPASDVTDVRVTWGSPRGLPPGFHVRLGGHPGD